MPVRSLNSSVLRWPEAGDVISAFQGWADRHHNADVSRIGYFGSYARGDWGVGSDLDVIVVLKDSERPFGRRLVGWDTTDLPVPVDLLVYTEKEWDVVSRAGMAKVQREIVWVISPSDENDA